MSKTILSDPLPDPFLAALGSAFQVRPLEDALAGDPASDIDRDVLAIIAYGHPTVDGAAMDRFPNLRVISNHGVGVDHIDVRAAADRSVPVGNTPGCLDAATADLTIALLMAVARNVVVGDHYARGPDFNVYDPAILIGREVTGSTLGIVGLGRIGAEVARRARGFDMKLLYHNRSRRPEIEASLGVEYCSLVDLLQQSDFVSLNCPLTDETTGLISRNELESMKPNAILLNMARGPVVDTNDLFVALSTGTIAAAGLDVTDPEPLPRDHPLLRLDNVVITPHLGSASDRTRQRMRDMTIENLNAGLAGKPLPYSVGPKKHG